MTVAITCESAPLGPVRHSSPPSIMAKRGTKATRKFAASGQLTKKIQARRKHQQIQKKINKNKSARSKGRERPANDGENEDESATEIKSLKKRYVCILISVDDTLQFWDIALKA